MATPQFINGQGGSVLVGMTTIDVVSWSATAEVEILDTTHTGSQGWQNNINGIQKVEGSMKMNFDPANDQAATLSVGVSVTPTLPLGASGRSFSGPARISKISVENAAKGVVTYNADFVSNGVWTCPT